MAALIRFFCLTYAVAWLLWLAASLIPPGTPLRTLAFLPGTFAPAIVALWLGPRSVVDRIFLWRVPVRWYAFASLYIGAIKLAAALVNRAVTGTWAGIEAGPWFLFVAAVLTSAPFQAGEEVGWRGYALPHLGDRFGLGIAGLILGVIWAAWHLPLFFIPATDLTGQSFPVYLLSVMAISVAITWLYAHTNGSLLLVMLLHSAVNNTPHFVPAAKPDSVFGVRASLVSWITILFLWIAAGYFLVRMRNVRNPVNPSPEGAARLSRVS